MTTIQAIYSYVYSWGNTPERAALKGRRCRVMGREDATNSLVEFEDGEQAVVSRAALREAKTGVAPKRQSATRRAPTTVLSLDEVLQALQRRGPAFEWELEPQPEYSASGWTPPGKGYVLVTARRLYEGRPREWKHRVDLDKLPRDAAAAGDEIAHQARVKWWRLLKTGDSEAFVARPAMRRRGQKTCRVSQSL
jgi:hypothetical protein